MLEVIPQGHSLLFMGSPPPSSRIPVEMLLPQLQSKREVLWEEVASLLIKGTMETVQVLQNHGKIFFSLLPGSQMHCWDPPHPQPQWTQHIPPHFEVPCGDPHLYYPLSSPGLVDGVAGHHLKGGYLHVPIHPSHWRHFWFAFRNAEGDLTVYQGPPFWLNHCGVSCIRT